MMTFEDLVFYVFSLLLVGSASVVITARNPVYSVLFLILAFFNAAGLFLLIGAEFIALMFVIVYVGAIAVLFLFVVMMLDIRFESLRKLSKKHIGIGVGLGAVLFAEILFILLPYMRKSSDKVSLSFTGISTLEKGSSDIALVGAALYTEYFYIFQMIGMILLVAMVAAIVLSMRERVGVRHQKIGEQLSRNPRKSVELVSMEPGEGMK